MPTRSYAFAPSLRERLQGNLASFEVRGPSVEHRSLREAAVSVVVVGDATEEACFLLTLRGGRLRAHAGQFALPGGSVDPGETPVDAALRELREEVGLAVSTEHVLGSLDPFPTRSGRLIRAFVVWGMLQPTLRLSPDEVEDAYLVPLADLDRPGNPRLLPGAERSRPLLSLSVLDTVVFAPTAAILYQFREVALHGREARVDHVEQPSFAWR